MVTLTDLIDSLKEKYEASLKELDEITEMRVKKENYKKLCEELRKNGFDRLSYLTAVDWIEQKKFEVFAVLYSSKFNKYLKIATEIPRDNPEISSICDLWKNAKIHERETWELFRINFVGNDELKPLFLEDWDGPPPFRKDFDWREFAKKELAEAMKE